mgnify:CR=1 FL=1
MGTRRLICFTHLRCAGQLLPQRKQRWLRAENHHILVGCRYHQAAKTSHSSVGQVEARSFHGRQGCWAAAVLVSLKQHISCDSSAKSRLLPRKPTEGRIVHSYSHEARPYPVLLDWSLRPFSATQSWLGKYLCSTALQPIKCIERPQNSSKGTKTKQYSVMSK